MEQIEDFELFYNKEIMEDDEDGFYKNVNSNIFSERSLG